jgi:MATE family multidrug resistance protein
MVAAWHAAPILVVLGQDAALAAASQSYLRFMTLGLIPALWAFVLSEILAAHLRPRPTLVVTVVAIAVNGLVDYALMFGHFGFPAMGLDGAGVASAGVGVFMFSCLMAFVLIDRRLAR